MEPKRILIVLPNWIGDVVLATPALAAIRARHAAARIVFLARRYVADVVRHSGWMDEVLFWPQRSADAGGPRSTWALLRRLRRERFDLAVLLPNSFRSALAAWLGGARRRIGYARDGRGALLTDRLSQPTVNGRRLAVSMLDSYAALAAAAGCREVGRRPTLAVGPDDEAALAARLGPPDPTRPLVMVNPGGAYGTAKLWSAERFAAVGDALAREFGARVVMSGTPAERPIAQTIARCAQERPTLCFDPPLGIGPLKALARRADLLVTNDTGPRHFAVAFGVPVVTVFGPTDPAWTESGFELERKVMLALDCMPCQQKVCPLGHTNCMVQLETERVLEAARDLLRKRLVRHDQAAGRAAPSSVGVPLAGREARVGP